MVDLQRYARCDIILVSRRHFELTVPFNQRDTSGMFEIKENIKINFFLIGKFMNNTF